MNMAYYNSNDERNPILQIQRILRDLDYRDNSQARIRLTGTYNGETENAVREFQQKYELPVTGVVDSVTWQVLHSVNKAQKEAFALARAVYILPRNEEYSIFPNTRDDVIYVIQHMLNVIGQEYDEIERIPFSGVYDTETQNAIKVFQRKNMLESDGIINPSTFNRLADEYERINSYNQ